MVGPLGAVSARHDPYPLTGSSQAKEITRFVQRLDFRSRVESFNFDVLTRRLSISEVLRDAHKVIFGRVVDCPYEVLRFIEPGEAGELPRGVKRFWNEVVIPASTADDLDNKIAAVLIIGAFNHAYGGQFNHLIQAAIDAGVEFSDGDKAKKLLAQPWEPFQGDASLYWTNVFVGERGFPLPIIDLSSVYEVATTIGEIVRHYFGKKADIYHLKDANLVPEENRIPTREELCVIAQILFPVAIINPCRMPIHPPRQALYVIGAFNRRFGYRLNSLIEAYLQVDKIDIYPNESLEMIYKPTERPQLFGVNMEEIKRYRAMYPPKGPTPANSQKVEGGIPTFHV